MLRLLDIRDLLLIDSLSLAFRPGLNVLTGETGAGKSILLDALGFVLGWRGRADLVRAGADRGEVTAVFDLSPDHPVRAILSEAGFDVDDELILRRVTTPDGRKSGWINDRRAGGDLLRQVGAELVELHGQQDDRGLLDPRGHRALLDAFGRTDALRAAVRAAWTDRRTAQAALDAAEQSADRIAAEADFLRHAVAELDRLAPEPGEADALDAARRRMQAAARIRDDIARALQAVGEDGAGALAAEALRRLDAAAGQAEGRLDGALDALSRAIDALGEAEDGITACLDALDHDPRTLEEVEERLFALRALARKHGVPPDDLAALAEDMRSRLAGADNADADRAARARAATAAAARHAAACADLTAARRTAADRLAEAMAGELPPLKLDRARFAVQIAAGQPGPDGADDVTFVVATNPGAPPGALNRIASGGELSRFLLALKVCLTGGDRGRVMVFDEIDRGVGGATADAVGRRLWRLAAGGQVLVVTHSPQVAALGAHHWRVEKAVAGEVTTSRVIPLDPAGREDEIARMLSGDRISAAARAAARALMSGTDDAA